MGWKLITVFGKSPMTSGIAMTFAPVHSAIAIASPK